MIAGSAYDPGPWQNLGVATAGAAAALTGLLFVAVSINLKRILQYPSLPARAAGTLALLLCLLLASVFILGPDQSNRMLGAELAVTGLSLALGAVVPGLRADRSVGNPPNTTLVALIILLLPAISLIVAGLSLAAERGGGLYWLLAATIFGFTGAVVNAWVLLVEIER